MDTKQAHAHIWAKVRPFDGQSVLYAFRFDNGRSKFGKSTNILSRTNDYLVHGITGCVGVTVVRVAPEKLDAAERDMLEHVKSRYFQFTSEVFASSPGEAHDEQLIREAIGPQTVDSLPVSSGERAAVQTMQYGQRMREEEARRRIMREEYEERMRNERAQHEKRMRERGDSPWRQEAAALRRRLGLEQK